METNEKIYWPLSTKLLGIAFALLFIDFVLYKIFGEPIREYHSTGWYIFVTTTVLCGASFLGGGLVFILECVASYKKKKGKN